MKIKDLGQIVATREVTDLQESDQEFAIFVDVCLKRYLSNDWGILPKGDKKMNDKAAKSEDDRILASYPFPSDSPWTAVNSYGGKEDRLWIITEWARSVTTILFPGEY